MLEVDVAEVLRLRLLLAGEVINVLRHRLHVG